MKIQSIIWCLLLSDLSPKAHPAKLGLPFVNPGRATFCAISSWSNMLPKDGPVFSGIASRKHVASTRDGHAYRLIRECLHLHLEEVCLYFQAWTANIYCKQNLLSKIVSWVMFPSAAWQRVLLYARRDMHAWYRRWTFQSVCFCVSFSVLASILPLYDERLYAQAWHLREQCCLYAQVNLHLCLN